MRGGLAMDPKAIASPGRSSGAAVQLALLGGVTILGSLLLAALGYLLWTHGGRPGQVVLTAIGWFLAISAGLTVLGMIGWVLVTTLREAVASRRLAALRATP